MISQTEFEQKIQGASTEEVLPIVLDYVQMNRQDVKNQAVHLVRNFFPDPHEADDGCSDCLLVQAMAETLEGYLV